MLYLFGTYPMNRSISLSLALALCVSPALVAQDTSSGAVFTWSGRIASGGTLEIRHYNGPIEVRESANDQIDFRAERRSRRSSELTFEVENGTGGVTICAVWRGRNSCDRSGGWDWDDGPPSSRIVVTLPKGIRLNANTGNGDVSVEKASNDVSAHSGNGDIRVSLTAGKVDVATGNGVLDISGATGPVHASTGNGRVYVVTSTGPVDVSTGNGDIDVRMNALSNNADMTYSTGNGSISVALPPSFNGEVDANTGNGEFRSDFEIRVIGRLNPHHVRGSIGTGGGQLIRMNTGSGRLELRKSS
jgi:Putative adhesin